MGGLRFLGGTSPAALEEINEELDGKQSLDEKGQAGGYAELDPSGNVPVDQMPVGALTYKGTWNASTNTPALTDGAGKAGEQYFVSTTGTRNLGSGSTEFVAGSVILHNGTVWQQLAAPDAVSEVFGRKGAVEPQAGDYSIDEIEGAGTAAAADVGVDVAAANDSRLEFNKNFGVAMVVSGEDINKARPTGASRTFWLCEPGFVPVNKQPYDVVIEEHGDWD